jgi:hypothetical protein
MRSRGDRILSDGFEIRLLTTIRSDRILPTVIRFIRTFSGYVRLSELPDSGRIHAIRTDEIRSVEYAVSDMVRLSELHDFHRICDV